MPALCPQGNSTSFGQSYQERTHQKLSSVLARACKVQVGLKAFKVSFPPFSPVILKHYFPSFLSVPQSQSYAFLLQHTVLTPSIQILASIATSLRSQNPVSRNGFKIHCNPPSYKTKHFLPWRMNTYAKINK